LQCFGFPVRFLSWIKECITSPKFFVCINSTLVGYFEGKKGLRQGDPISPYLFVFAMEVFSRIIEKHTSIHSGFRFHPKCEGLRLTHLCFADDLLVFSEASMSSISVIKAALLEFENLSGLKVNPSKSSFFCSGVSERVKHVLLEELMMKEGHLPVRYLGEPLISSRLSSADCGTLLDKITGRIDSWLSKNLSYAGRLQLLSLFYTVYKSIGQVFSSSLRRLSKLLNKSLIVSCGMGIVKVQQRPKSLGLTFVSPKKREVWV
jgi:hypothetical protein